MHILLDILEGRIGNWEVKNFGLTVEQAMYYNTRELRSLKRYIKPNLTDKYLLKHGVDRFPKGYTVMSNTPAEIKDFVPFISSAAGDVLIFGLGLGEIVQGLLAKDDVNTITITEIDPDIIELTGKHYLIKSSEISIIQGDPYLYSDSKKYGAIWFDIWNEISVENLVHMTKLKEKWKTNSKIRMCWAEKECRRLGKL